MGKIDNAINEIYEIEEMAEKKTTIHQIHPLVKLLTTIFYITCVVSFDKYNLIGLLPMILYPLLMFPLSDIKIKTCLKKLRVVLPMVCFVGLWNPFFDHRAIITVGNVVITGGMVSMVTLMIKGSFALLASFLLIATTGIEQICYSLTLLHVPSIIVTQILLAYRYITLLMIEANTMYEAYSLRAPKEKGIKYKIWGPFIGQLLFRSIDRAKTLYESMMLRGFQGEYYFSSNKKCTGMDYLYFILWGIMILLIRFYHVLAMKIDVLCL